jgi:hypothetical protein
MVADRELLFSYGSLQRKAVQAANFGRELEGRADALPGFVRRLVPIDDAEDAELVGESHYANAEPCDDGGESLVGTVYEVSLEELAAADRYEAPAGYRRIRVTLASGVVAWAYVRQPDANL